MHYSYSLVYDLPFKISELLLIFLIFRFLFPLLCESWHPDASSHLLTTSSGIFLSLVFIFFLCVSCFYYYFSFSLKSRREDVSSCDKIRNAGIPGDSSWRTQLLVPNGQASSIWNLFSSLGISYVFCRFKPSKDSSFISFKEKSSRDHKKRSYFWISIFIRKRFLWDTACKGELESEVINLVIQKRGIH